MHTHTRPANHITSPLPPLRTQPAYPIPPPQRPSFSEVVEELDSLEALLHADPASCQLPATAAAAQTAAANGGLQWWQQPCWQGLQTPDMCESLDLDGTASRLAVMVQQQQQQQQLEEGTEGEQQGGGALAAWTAAQQQQQQQQTPVGAGPPWPFGQQQHLQQQQQQQQQQHLQQQQHPQQQTFLEQLHFLEQQQQQQQQRQRHSPQQAAAARTLFAPTNCSPLPPLPRLSPTPLPPLLSSDCVGEGVGGGAVGGGGGGEEGAYGSSFLPDAQPNEQESIENSMGAIGPGSLCPYPPGVQPPQQLQQQQHHHHHLQQQQ